MTTEEMQAVGRRYSSKFDNLDEVSHPMIIFDQRFIELLERAIARGTELTRSEVEAVWPDVAWEE